jgi:hypothetical protein
MTQFKMPSLNTPLLLPVLLLLLVISAYVIYYYISKDNTIEGFDQNVDIETIQIIKKDLKSEEYKKYIGNEKALLSDIKDGVITEFKLKEFMKSIGEIPTSGYKKTTTPWKKQIGQETGTICYKPKGIMWGAANGPSIYDQIFYLDNNSWKMIPHSKLSDSLSKLISLYTTPDGKCKTLKSGQSVTVNGIELLCNNDKLVIKITPQAYRPTAEVCKDNNKWCEDWAKSGECKKNPAYMLENCKKSCKVCDSPAAPAAAPAAATAAAPAAAKVLKKVQGFEGFEGPQDLEEVEGFEESLLGFNSKTLLADIRKAVKQETSTILKKGITQNLNNAIISAANKSGYVDSCSGNVCNTTDEGKICKKGSKGAINHNYICKNKKWEIIADSCEGDKCGIDQQDQICLLGSTGASSYNYQCKNKKWNIVEGLGNISGPGISSSNIPVSINNKFVSVIRSDRNGYNCGNTSYEGNEKVNIYISSITNYCNKLINTYEKLNKEPSTVIVENKIAVPADMSQQEKYKFNKLKESILQNQIDTLEKEAPFKNTVNDKKNQLIDAKKTTAKILQQITSGIETINTLSSITFNVSNNLYDSITVKDYNSTFYNDNLLIIMTGGNNVGVINKLKTDNLTKLTNKINVDETSIFSENNKKAILEVLNQYKIEVVEKKQKDAMKQDTIKKEKSVLTDLNINNINLKGLQNIANALAVKDKTVATDINPIKYNETDLRKYLKKYLAKNHSNKKDVTEYFNANIFK